MTLAQVLMQHIPDDGLSDDYTWYCQCGAEGEITDEGGPTVEELWSQHVVESIEESDSVVANTKVIYGIRMWEADSYWRFDAIEEPFTDFGKRRIRNSIEDTARKELQLRADPDIDTDDWPGFQAEFVKQTITTGEFIPMNLPAVDE